MIKKENKFTDVKLGTDYNIDKDAILGYRPSRKVISKELVIGEKARIRSGNVIYLGTRIGHNLETRHNVLFREEKEIVSVTTFVS